MFTGNQVMPLPGLTAKERQTTYDGPGQPFHYPCFITFVTGMNGQYHGHRTDDQDKGHHTHESKRQIGMTGTRKCIKYHVGIRPEVLGKADRPIGDEESAESKGITH